MKQLKLISENDQALKVLRGIKEEINCRLKDPTMLGCKSG